MTTPTIYVMNADGSAQVDLTNDPSSFDSDPAWSPDGEHIAYSHFGFSSGERSEIYVMNADGSDKTI